MVLFPGTVDKMGGVGSKPSDNKTELFKGKVTNEFAAEARRALSTVVILVYACTLLAMVTLDRQYDDITYALVAGGAGVIVLWLRTGRQTAKEKAVNERMRMELEREKAPAPPAGPVGSRGSAPHVTKKR